MFIKSFHSGSDGKESAYNAGDLNLIPGLGRGNGNPLQYSCLQNSMGKELETYSPWGCKESDTTEQLTHIHVHQVSEIVSLKEKDLDLGFPLWYKG